MRERVVPVRRVPGPVRAVAVLAPALVACFAATSLEAATLSNGIVRADVGARGLTTLTDTDTGATFTFTQDEFAVVVGGTRIESRQLPTPVQRPGADTVTLTWASGSYRLDVVYELKPAWRFVSKQIVVAAAPGPRFTVDEVVVFDATMARAPLEIDVPALERRQLGVGEYGGFLRVDRNVGMLALAQNPFLDFEAEGRGFTLRYRPEMEWRTAYGPFAADRGILAPYGLSGRRLPAQMLPEWSMGPIGPDTGLDEGEIAAFTEVVRAFLLYRPTAPLDIFVGWCVNDYQIDIATPEGRAEYKRIIDRAADLGARHVLFAPTNSDLAKREDSIDDWSWENLLWLGLGQRIRRNEWSPKTSELPASVREMLDYASSRHLGLVAYVYPIVAFSQNSEWLTTRRDRPGRQYASLGVRSLQDWLIETLVDFHARTGISGYAFDHTFLVFDGTSAYAQWWGWRRVMETLRQRIPDLVIDGRQAYHLYGPWSWLAGSYPHPTYSDEQPESFVPFPDLSFDRVSAARQRYTAYRFRNHDFAPSEIVPGFITHQTGRNDDTGRMPQTPTDRGVMLNRFRPRDWDYLGWRYSLLSSIATGGWNNVLNMIPARDPAEFEHFAERDRAWFRRWIAWTHDHKEYLRHTRTILGQPALGKVDGTAAIRDDRGFLFLFNPNARRIPAAFTLDASLGLSRPGRYVLAELDPVEGRLIGKPGAGFWSHGDRVTIEMDGQSALALEVRPAEDVREPALFGAAGSVSSSGTMLVLDDARGEIGTRAELIIVVPGGQAVSAVRVNGRDLPFTRAAPDTIAVQVRFDGTPFRRAQQVGAYDPSFAGGTFKGAFVVPQRIFDQLAARQRAWPIPWTPEDYRSTWLAPQRLLLYVQVAEPDDRWEPRLRIDGRLVELRKAYTAVRAASRTFVGFYADVSLLTSDHEYAVELDLPPLKPGQFQGLFFQNVEPELTAVLAR